MDEKLKKNFFITHFFNPPRYMKLVEFIYSESNSKDLIVNMASFMEQILGKGVVYAKDTPNFIANRIGVFGMMVTVNEAIKRIKLAVSKYMPYINLHTFEPSVINDDQKPGGIATVGLKITYSIPAAKSGTQAMEVVLYTAG